MALVRKISPLDCRYLAAETEISSPMVNQYVIEGLGSISQLELKTALELVSEKNPGIRLRLKGRWFWRYWDSEGREAKITYQKSNWSGSCSEQASFDGNYLNCSKGESAEVYYFEGEFPKLVFRTHHAVLDGNATLFWIKEVFRALRGEPLLGSQCGLNEWDLAQRFKKPLPEKLMGPWNSVFSMIPKSEVKNEFENSSPCHWQNIILKCKDDRVLPKVIAFINNKAREFHKNPKAIKVLIRVPSDLRRLLPAEDPYQLGNLVAALDLEIEADSDALSVYKKIMRGLNRKQDWAMFTNFIKIAKFLPSSVFLHKASHFSKLHEQGLADISAIVTHVGRIDLHELSSTDFKALNIYALPVPLEGVSISCVFIAHDKGLSLCLSAPKSIISLVGLKNFASEMESYINTVNNPTNSGSVNLVK